MYNIYIYIYNMNVTTSPICRGVRAMLRLVLIRLYGSGPADLTTGGTNLAHLALQPTAPPS